VTALPETGTVHVWLAHFGEFDGTAAALADEAVRAQRFAYDDDRRRFEVRGQAVAMPESAVGFAVQDLAVPAGASGSVALAAAAIAVEIRPFPPQRRRPRAMPRPSGLLQISDKEHVRPPEMNP
jgi:hypothetical protein